MLLIARFELAISAYQAKDMAKSTNLSLQSPRHLLLPDRSC